MGMQRRRHFDVCKLIDKRRQFEESFDRSITQHRAFR
jgi:hypothetical protein